jgi:uncharacterized protein YabE (DUF348 family)
MKTIFWGIISIMMFVSIGQEQTNKTVTATFDGYEDGIYTFSNGEEEVYDFEKIDDEVAKEFNLKTDKYINKKFKITYKSETVKTEEDGEEMETEIWTILKLELVK